MLDIQKKNVVLLKIIQKLMSRIVHLGISGTKDIFKVYK